MGKEQDFALYPWLCTIAMGRIKDTHRRHVLAQRRAVGREAPAFAEPQDSETPSRVAVDNEMSELMSLAVRQLPLRDQQLLRMRYFENKKLAEIAAALGMSETNVKTRHFRLLKVLKTAMKGMAYESNESREDT